MADFKTTLGAPTAHYELTKAGNLWLVRIKQHKYAKVALVDGVGLTVSSNNPGVVPNDPLVFKGKTGSDKSRIVEFYGLSAGTSMIEAREGEGGSVVTHLQVQVEALSTKGPTWVALDSPHAALNAVDSPVPYQMKHSFTIKKGEKVGDVIKKVPSGIKHLVISCHGKPEGVLEIGENFDKSNVTEFSALKSLKLLVIWIGACSVAGTPEGTAFCQEVAKNSGCHVVAPTITCPFVRPPIGRVELGEMRKYINPKGDTIKPIEFFTQHKSLGFNVE